MKLLSLIESVKLHEGEERQIIHRATVDKLVDHFENRVDNYDTLPDLHDAIYNELSYLDMEDIGMEGVSDAGQPLMDFHSGRVLDVLDSYGVIDDVVARLDLSELDEGLFDKHSYDPVKPGGQSSPRKPVPVKGQKVKLDNEVYVVTHVSADKKTFDVVNVKDDSERHIDVKVNSNPFFIESGTTISEVVSDKDAELIIKQIIKTHGPRNLESVFRDYFPKMSDAEVDNFLKNYKKSNLTLIKNEDVDINDNMIGEPDRYFDAEQRQEAHKDLQNALQGNYMDDYIVDGSCPACAGSGYMDGEDEVYNDETEEYEEGTECDGFGNYGCDEGEMTYGNDSPSWVEIIKHDKRQAERQKAKDEYPGDEAVIDFAASTAKQLKRSDQDPRDTMEYVRREYPHLGRAQRASLVAKGMKQAGLTNEGQRCWKGYEKKGTKMMFGKRVNNCVKKEGRIEDTFDTNRIDKHDRPEKKKKKDMKEMDAFIRAGDELMIETSDGEGIVVPVLHVVDENILVGWDNLAEEIVTEHALQLEELRRLAGIDEDVSANTQNMFDELRIDDNTNITDGNKELTTAEVDSGFYLLGFDRDGRCFEMNKISKERAKDSITGYGEYKVSDADITDFDGARYYYNENMPDSGVLNIKQAANEAEYQGRKVKLGKPTRGDVKKFKVYVKDPKTGNVKKVNFGHGGTSAKKAGQKTMKIKKSNPARRKSFRARHNCDNPGPRTKARYWSCRAW